MRNLLEKPSTPLQNIVDVSAIQHSEAKGRGGGLKMMLLFPQNMIMCCRSGIDVNVRLGCQGFQMKSETIKLKCNLGNRNIQ